MGTRFEEFKCRMQSESTIKKIEDDLAENEAFLAANLDAPQHPLRMLRAALGAMRANLAELRQLHGKRFGRRFAK